MLPGIWDQLIPRVSPMSTQSQQWCGPPWTSVPPSDGLDDSGDPFRANVLGSKLSLENVAANIPFRALLPILGPPSTNGRCRHTLTMTQFGIGSWDGEEGCSLRS